MPRMVSIFAAEKPQARTFAGSAASSDSGRGMLAREQSEEPRRVARPRPAKLLVRNRPHQRLVGAGAVLPHPARPEPADQRREFGVAGGEVGGSAGSGHARH